MGTIDLINRETHCDGFGSCRFLTLLLGDALTGGLRRSLRRFFICKQKIDRRTGLVIADGLNSFVQLAAARLGENFSLQRLKELHMNELADKAFPVLHAL